MNRIRSGVDRIEGRAQNVRPWLVTYRQPKATTSLRPPHQSVGRHSTTIRKLVWGNELTGGRLLRTMAARLA
jgi:hypothetical protein